MKTLKSCCGGLVQLQLTLIWLMHKLCPFFAETLVTCPWQVKLLQKSYGRQIQWDNNKCHTFVVRRKETIVKELWKINIIKQ